MLTSGQLEPSHLMTHGSLSALLASLDMSSPPEKSPRVAIVTGVAQGLLVGFLIALRPAQDGYHIAVNDVTSELA